MNQDKGFTLIELLMIIVILGILALSAFPTYQTFRNRAVGSEAITIMKQLVDAQIIYFLENEKYFPDPGQTILITHNAALAEAEEQQTSVPPNMLIKEALKITIPLGHHLDFTISNMGEGCLMTISSPENSFSLFKNGATTIRKTIDEKGNVATDYH
jgi:prepilin-type N-terminal cleavage/methylation domain-containing protein